MKLYAWVGEDEHGSGVVGLKQAWCRAGYVPLVVIEGDVHKITTSDIIDGLRDQARTYGKTIRLVEFESTHDVKVIEGKN